MNEPVELTIDSLSHGGSGVGRLDGLVYFVPFAAPGDRVKVQTVYAKKNYVEAEILEILTAGPSRVIPPCPVFGQCGGCQWQHVNYEDQLRQKELMVKHAVSRIGRESQDLVRPIKASPSEWNYRNRAQIRTLGKKVGFYQRGSKNLVDVKECRILEAPLNEELGRIRSEVSAQPRDLEEKIEIYTSLKGIHRSKNRAHGEESGFSQVNTEQNLNLVEFVLSQIPSHAKTLLDLYCGNGNFSIPATNRKGLSVAGIDFSRAAITEAQRSGKGQFLAGDCTAEVEKLAQTRKHFDAIILDPPRIGCDAKLWKNLIDLKAEKIVYVSCDPATFARDFARLKNTSGDRYQIDFIQPFDMFPQTFHVELVAVISQKAP